MTSTSVSTNPGLTLAGALQNYDDVYLHCRGVQHRWQVITDLHITENLDEGQLIERHLECENCETIRRDRFLMRLDRWKVSRLEVLGAVYQYPENYLMPEMVQADHPREILRHEQLRRALGTRRLNAAKKSAAAQQSQQNQQSEDPQAS